MSTHANMLLRDKQDFISLHTRWDGFPDEIKEKIFNLEKTYKNGLSISYDLLKTDSPVIQQYLDNLTKLVNKKDKTIQDWAKINIISNLNHFHQLPEIGNNEYEELKDYWGYDYPDIIFRLKEDSSFSVRNNTKKQNFKEFDMNKTYQCKNDEWVLSIKNQNSNESSGCEFKVLIKGLTQKEFNKKVIDIPLFYTKLYEQFINNIKEAINNKSLSVNKETIEAIRVMLPIGNKFGFYYNNPYDFYNLNKLSEQDQMNIGMMFGVPPRNGYGQSLKDIEETVAAILVYDFSPENVVEHLMLRMPNNVELLPNNYQLKTKVDNEMVLSNVRNPVFQLQDDNIDKKSNLDEVKQYLKKEYTDYFKDNYGYLAKDVKLMLTETGCLAFNFNKNIIAAANNAKSTPLKRNNNISKTLKSYFNF